MGKTTMPAPDKPIVKHGWIAVDAETGEPRDYWLYEVAEHARLCNSSHKVEARRAVLTIHPKARKRAKGK